MERQRTVSEQQKVSKSARVSPTRRPVGYLLLALVVLSASSAFGQNGEFPWDRIVGFDHSYLEEDDTVRVVELANRIHNYFGCRGTVSECISLEPPDPTARRIAGYLARRVSAGDSSEEIEQGVVDRRRSARPTLTAEIDIDGASCFGAEEPLVTIVEFADFECPFCRLVSPIVEELAHARSDRVRFCFKLFPIQSHPRGVPSCVAAIAAARQSLFWEMHDALYASSPDLSDEAIETAALVIGLDLDRFQRDCGDDELLEEVMADKFEGLELGVDRTPTIFINGKHYYGRLCNLELADRIDEELEMTESSR